MCEAPPCPTVVLVTDRSSWVPPRLDVAIAALFVALSLAEVFVNGSVRSPLEHVLVTGLAMSSLAWRRRFPILVAVLVISSNVVTNPQGEFSVLLSLVLVSFTVGAETEPPRSYVGLAAVLVPFMAAMIRAGLVPSDIAAAMVFLVGPWAVGTLVRQRSAHAAEALSRAERLEREQELQATLAAAAERTRIARELHDIVSHSISVVTIQTQAVRRRLGPEHAAEAADLAAVEATAREALAEMRRLFGVLRADGESASLTPQPGLAELRRLVGQVGSGDLAVSLQVEGEPYDLPPGLDLAAYRIAQEGLTNALRYGADRAVLLRVNGDQDALRIHASNASNGQGGHGRSQGSGLGLLGMAERVALLGGTLSHGVTANGRFELDATLPVTR
jgi:signal transduction histidine kinase